jgi:hypothetical protein
MRVGASAAEPISRKEAGGGLPSSARLAYCLSALVGGQVSHSDPLTFFGSDLKHS